MNSCKILTVAVALTMSLYACDKMDSSYEEYIKGGETIYVSKANSVKVYPGNNRVKLAWDLGTDPKITKAKIYWNDGADSAEKVIDRSLGENTVEVILDHMTEGAYSFDIFTLDNKGHQSVKVTVSGNVYGETYKNDLKNRILKDVLLVDGITTINWYSETANATTEVTYTDNTDQVRTIEVPSTENLTRLADYKSRTGFKYITRYLPDSLAIDAFYVNDYVTRPNIIEDISSKYLKNYSQPFTSDLYDGSRWGTLKDWTTSASAKNQGTTTKIYGGYDNYLNTVNPLYTTGFFGLQKVSADPVVLNGKISQTFTLPAGKYEFSWSQGAVTGNSNTGTDPRYIIVAEGSALPDIAALGTALSSKTFVGVTSAATTFTLASEKQISIGVLVNFPASTVTQSIRSAGFKLLDVTE